jgi:ornithine carbamoyltransferase
MTAAEASKRGPKPAPRRGAKGLRHFLDLDQIPTATLRAILDLGHAYKRGEEPTGGARPCAGKTLAMVFEKPSTRTRVSFEVGMKQLGGFVTIINSQESQLGRGETIADTSRVLSRYADVIMFRTLRESSLVEMAAHATVPVINGLSDKSHPCQIMADLMTFEEIKGPLAGRTVTWVGDGNNVCASWVHATAHFGFTLRVATPKALAPDARMVERVRAAGGDVVLLTDPAEAVDGADCVVTDTWLSMGHGVDGDAALKAHIAQLEPYRVDDELMARAAPGAVFMHCLPASREREVSAAVIDGPQSVVWDEAENRLHVQKGILHWCLSGTGA